MRFFSVVLVLVFFVLGFREGWIVWLFLYGDFRYYIFFLRGVGELAVLDRFEG